MFSKLREHFRRSVSSRLIAWYCTFFVLSLAALFLLVYFSLSSTLEKKDRELIRSKLKEFAGEYKENGLTELRKRSAEKRSTTFFVRLADAKNRTIFLNTPEEEDWSPDMLRAIEQTPIEGERWSTFPVPHEGVLEITNGRLSDGNFLQVGCSSRRRQIFLSHFRRVCAAVILPMILLAICGGALLVRSALSPIYALNATVRGIIETGKIDARISEPKTAGELRELVISFNQMLGKIDALITGMRDMLDNVAHDLRTPITRLRGIAEMALRNRDDDVAVREALADCVEESERVVAMLNTLMDISEVETGAMKLDLKPVNVSKVVEQLTEIYRDVADEKAITLSTKSLAGCAVTADENRLRQAIGNLLDNAIKYTPEGGRVSVEVQKSDGQVLVGVRDTGVGIPKEDMPHVWERLYRTDESRSRRGLGLGLSLVKAIVQAHAGQCEVESLPGAGSFFQLRLPAMR
jgi:signal transduction histidine kinase